MLSFAGVVRVAVDAVDPDDREQHVVAHGGALFGGEQITGQCAEVRHRIVGVGGVRVGRVDDRFDTGERVVEPITGDEVHTVSTADSHDAVPGLLERCDGE